MKKRNNTNTQWNAVDISAETSRFVRGDYKIWSRISDGEHIFQVKTEKPGNTEGGYFSIMTALKVKGFVN